MFNEQYHFCDNYKIEFSTTFDDTDIRTRTMLPKDHFNETENNCCSGYISVPEFYNGKSIFITGATGFMGKVAHFYFSIKSNI